MPALRLRARNAAPVHPDGDYVLYWMIAHRRAAWNFGLDHAIARAQELHKPLLVLEALRCDYPWASDRLHRFVLDGMAENARRFARTPALYHPYVESSPGAGKGLLDALARRACLVVTDDFPCFFLPRMVAAAARRLSVRLEQADSNGLLPLRLADRAFPTAHVFRRFLQLELPRCLAEFPQARPFSSAGLPRLDSLPAGITRRWPAASSALLAGDPAALARLPLDHSVGLVATQGGSAEAEATLKQFLRQRLPRYLDDRLRLDQPATSGLSPYLHFGHISPHQVFHELMAQEGWSPDRLGPRASGSRSGWWGVSGEAEAFLDQIITWRELGFNFCAQRDDAHRFQSLPPWAQATLAEHTADPRPHLYTLGQFERAGTHDEVWNAAQRQLRDEGRMHNYLRMLWGKKILEWSRTPRRALEVMIELNNKYALDGRDPNSYSGIFWCLGRYDRPWGPERPVFGKVRTMSSARTARKVVGLGPLRR